MRLKRGFTLIELMVVITIIGILSSIVYMNLNANNLRARDVKRQSDLRQMQTALALYKQQFGRYPAAGCTDSNGDNFSNETECTDYISGLAPTYMPRLPRDPNRRTFEGYSYAVNADGSVYKIMALNTVESDVLTYTHPFKSCDIRPSAAGTFQFVNGNNIDTGGWCAFVYPENSDVDRCQMAVDNAGVVGRFDRSYAVWGGFAAETGGTSRAQQVSNTTAIICR